MNHNTQIITTFQQLVIEAEFQMKANPTSENLALSIMIGMYEQIKPLLMQAVESYDVPTTEFWVYHYLNDHLEMAKEESLSLLDEGMPTLATQKAMEWKVWQDLHDLFVRLSSHCLIPMNEERILI